MIRNLLLSIILLFLIPSIAIASYIYQGVKPGQTIYPVNSEDIKLVELKILVNSEYAKAVYDLENTQDESINVRIGFPFYEYQEPTLRYELGGIVDGELSDGFEVKVDGERVNNISRAQSEFFDYMYIWTVKFSPNERRRIECKYRIAWSFDPRWYPARTRFNYVLSTAAYWKDAIQKADIYINLDDTIVNYFKKGLIELEVEPINYDIVNFKTIEWHFTEWEPDNDNDISINVKGTESFIANVRDSINIEQITSDLKTKKTYDGNIRKYSLNDLNKYNNNDMLAKLYVKVLRNEIFARHGRTFQSEDLKSIFHNTDWYKPNPNYSDDMLNDIEKKNIQFILDYEKKKGWR